MRFAFTLDDAPTIVEPGVPSLPGTMDEIREQLVASHVPHCVAFVVGERALSHEGALKRWLDAGYELGNHSFGHEHASAVGVDAMIKSIDRCDELLEAVGAFETNRKWFRFPYLDRGADADARSQIQAHCVAKGYVVASASVSFGDHRYEACWQNAQTESDRERILFRYIDAARRSVRRAAGKMDSRGHSAAQIGYAHFGPVTNAAAMRLIRQLRSIGCSLCSLSEALDESLFGEFEQNLSRNGLVQDIARPKGALDRVGARLGQMSEALNLFDQQKFGPVWPYLR